MVCETRKIDLEGLHQGMETVKSVGKNVSDFFNGGLKVALSVLVLSYLITDLPYLYPCYKVAR